VVLASAVMVGLLCCVMASSGSREGESRSVEVRLTAGSPSPDTSAHGSVPIAEPDVGPTTTAAARSLDDQEMDRLLAEMASAAGAREVERTRSAIDDLARLLERRPELADPLLERILRLDGSGRAGEVAAALAAMGRTRNLEVPRAALRIYNALSGPGRVALAMGIAQDRGHSSTDPAGDRVFGSLFELRDIGEPEILGSVLDLASERALRAGPGVEDLGLSHLVEALALSVHRDPAVDDFMHRLASEDGPLRRTAELKYLTRSRSEGARALAIGILTGPSFDPMATRAAFIALRRFGADREDVHQIVTMGLRDAVPAKRAAILSCVPQLVSRRSPEATRNILRVEIRGALESEDRALRSTALVAAAEAAVRLGGWNSIGVRPGDQIRSPGISDEAKAQVMMSWASLYLAGEDDSGAFEQVLGDPDVDVPVRAAAWRGLEKMEPGLHAERLRSLALRYLAMEPDADLREKLRRMGR
jgi:hypothetical protein